MATRAGQILQADVIHGRGFRGGGEIVAVCDTGLDTGNIDDLHPALRQKILSMMAYKRRRADDPDGHGTHVAGCIVADGTATGNQRVRGTAPDARLVVQSVFYTQSDPFGNLPPVERMLLDAYETGARIHSNSWIRMMEKNGYSVTAERLDAFVHEHRDLLVITAVGNQGRYDHPNRPPKQGTVCVPATAKNGLAVGTTENDHPRFGKMYRDFFGDDLRALLPPIVANASWSADRNRVAPYSGSGWALTRRIKPDVVAPGTVVLSTRSTRLRRRQARRWREQWGDANEDGYILMGGTSASAPLVSGCAAVVREYLRRRAVEGGGVNTASLGASNPSAALVKAVLINGARPVFEYDGTSFTEPSTPSPVQGWGRVDLGASLPDEATSPLRLRIVDEGPGLPANEERQFRFQIANGGHPLRVTLCWTDAPGPDLVADLDLIVTAVGERRHGNRSAGDTGHDRENNVERVVWSDMPSGEVVVTIRAHRVTLPQRFALAVCGAIAP